MKNFTQKFIVLFNLVILTGTSINAQIDSTGCLIDYSDFGANHCYDAYMIYGLSYSALEEDYGWDCSGCPELNSVITCPFTSTLITTYSGQYDQEISLSITSSTNELVFARSQGNLDYEGYGVTNIIEGTPTYNAGVWDVCLDPQECYTINMTDYYGDGWNGAYFTINNESFTLPSGSEISYNFGDACEEEVCDYNLFSYELSQNNNFGVSIIDFNSYETLYSTAGGSTGEFCLNAEGCYILQLSNAEGVLDSMNIDYVIIEDQEFYFDQGEVVGGGAYSTFDPYLTTFSDIFATGCIIAGCTDPLSDNFDVMAVVNDGSCQQYEIGCMDSLAINHNSQALLDDGSCEYLSGCTDSLATNYNPDAILDDLQCEYSFVCNGDDFGNLYTILSNEYSFDLETVLQAPDYINSGNPCLDLLQEGIDYIIGLDQNIDNACCESYNNIVAFGCLDSLAINFAPNAVYGDNSCYYEIINGCIDALACNFNPEANTDNQSCVYVDATLNDFLIDNTWYGLSQGEEFIITYNPDGTGNYYLLSDEDSLNTPSFYYSLCTDDSGNIIYDDGYWNGTMVGNSNLITSEYFINGTSDVSFIMVTYSEYLNNSNLYGCTNPSAFNFDTLAIIPDLSSCIWDFTDDCIGDNTDSLGNYLTYFINEQMDVFMDSIEDVYDAWSIPFPENLCLDLFSTWQYSLGSIETIEKLCCSSFADVVLGCTDLNYSEYNPDANVEDGSCMVCEANLLNISVGAGDYPEEVSWSIDNWSGTAGEYQVCLSDGCYNFIMNDSYGDGWNGSLASITSVSGELLLTTTLEDGFSDEVMLAINEGCGNLGCTDPSASNYDPTVNQNDGSCISWQELINMAYEEGYNACSNTSENNPVSVNIPLHLPEGWSMFGYTCLEPQNVIEAFLGINENITIAKDYLGNAYLPEWGFNGIGSLEFARGYQIKMIESVDGFQFCTTLLGVEEEVSSPQYQVGDLAEGGIIFYIDETGEHGLVAATED